MSMRMIPARRVTAQSHAKARRFLFDTRQLSPAEFQIVGKPYTGRVETLRGELHVGCTCDAQNSCYHLPHYLARYEQARLFQAIWTDGEHAGLSEALDDAEEQVVRIGRIVGGSDRLDFDDAETIGRLAWRAGGAIRAARDLGRESETGAAIAA